MSRRTVILRTPEDRERVARWASKVEAGTTVEFRQARRSLDANRLLWAMLQDVSAQVEWYGERLTPEEFKDLFTAALRKSRAVPGIDGGIVMLGMRTSDMTKAEFSDLIELIRAFGAERGVRFSDEASDAA